MLYLLPRVLAQDICKKIPPVLYSYLDDPMPGGRQTHDAALVGLCLVLQCPMLDTLTSYNT